MPIYEYKCDICAEITEMFTSNSTRFIQCDCGGIARKIISKSSFKVKGFNANNNYAKSDRQQFIEDGPYDYEKRIKKMGKRTANEIINNTDTKI